MTGQQISTKYENYKDSLLMTIRMVSIKTNDAKQKRLKTSVEIYTEGRKEKGGKVRRKEDKT